MNVFVDTNILLNENFRLEDYSKVYVSIVSVEELDHQKSNEVLGYRARQAIRNLKDATNVKIELNYSYNGVINKFLEHGNDNHILGFAAQVCTKDKDCVLLTDDYNMSLKAKAMGIPCKPFEFEKDEDEIYTGIKEVWLDEEEMNEVLDNPASNSLHLYPNQYLLINNVTKNREYLYVWKEKDRYLEEVKAKAITNSYLKKKDKDGKEGKDNKIAPLDIYQRAFIHMLQNDEAKIKFTDSIYGAGKSFLMLHWAIQQIEKKKFKKLIFVKSDSPPKGRKDYPAIPGDINMKSDPLLGVIADSVSNDNAVNKLLEDKQLEIVPIQFAKGRSMKGAILFINEAQNFTPSEMEILLSRIGEGTVALVDGSSDQVDNRYCLHRNGLMVACENFKDRHNSAQVNMVEDYRSEISKMVSEMDWHD